MAAVIAVVQLVRRPEQQRHLLDFDDGDNVAVDLQNYYLLFVSIDLYSVWCMFEYFPRYNRQYGDSYVEHTVAV